jgi:hypothetical protein
MADIVNSLFGIDPAALQQQRAATDTAQAFRFAQLDPLQRATMAIYQGSAGIGRGINQLLGGDEQLNRATQVRQLASQFDMTSADGLRQFAQAVAPFAPDVAQQAAAAAARRQQQSLTAEKTQLDISRSEMSMAQETKLRDELSKLPADASDEQVIAIVSKYGSPDRILATLQSSQNRQAQMAQQRELAQQRIDIQREALAARQGAAEEKRQERSEKQEQAANLAIGAADRVINEVKQARDKVSGFTAGAGALLSFVPLTEAKDLSKRLTTIKANLGFDRLQQMRDASPTGGALGQVAVQELIALQSTIASLDQDQSPAQLKEALDKIEFHYSNWRDTVRKSGKATPTGTTPEAGKQGTAANPIVLK